MKQSFMKLLSVLLAFVLIFGVLPIQAFADITEDISPLSEGNEPVVVIAGSDFQDPNGHGDSSANVSSILTAVKQTYSSAYGFLFAGDYDYGYDSAAVGVATLRETLADSLLGFEDTVLVQGNHDPEALIEEGVLSASGNNDTLHYGVFVINEKDYMHNNTDEATVDATAAALDAYLAAKADEDYGKPIFIVSHLPLHYSMRTYRNGDARYAAKLFTVLNRYATAENLNIIYLYGHNHSHGWDDYLGGSSVFLRPGNVVLVSDGTNAGFDRYTLGFTYMNAGFTGYYSDMQSGADTALTMTTFAIYEDRVEINRFDANGAHNLKAHGYYGADYELDEVEASMYDPSARVYEHTETLFLNTHAAYVPEYGPETEDHGWVQISSSNSTLWRATSTLSAGKRYLILDNYTAGLHTALAKNTISSGLTTGEVTVIQDNGGNYVENGEVLDQLIWTYDNSRFSNNSYRNTAYYLRGNSSGDLRTTTRSNDSYTTWRNDSNYGLYSTRSKNNNSKYYISDTFSITSRSSRTDRVYLFAEETIQVPTLYASFLGSSGVKLLAGIYGSSSEIEHIIHESLTVFTASDTNGKGKTIVNDYTIVGDVNPAVAGNYTLSIQYQGVEITKYVVTVTEREITSISCDPMYGQATVGSTTTGSILTVTYADGSTTRQYVTLDMLSGGYNLRKAGTYEGLTITYGSQIFSGYTLNVYVNDYPEFPHEGSVRVNKGATGIDFSYTGVAKVDLAATGVPVKRGSDVIIMLDTSSSMNNTVSGQTRIDVLNEALAELINDLQRDGEDGTPMDIRIAIADFNGYYYNTSSPYYQNSNDHLSGTTARTTTSASVEVYTGDGTLSSGALVDVHDFTIRNGNIYDASDDHLEMTTASGTNYDYAFDAVYQIASSVKSANESNNEDRDLFVVFMSDGAPFQYNYYSSQSDASNWNNWLQGTVTNSMFSSGANKSYYNEDGKHWMAEAIKGDPDQRYTVIRKSTAGLADQLEATSTPNVYTLPGLGATMFSIGFCLAVDKQITVDSMTTVLKNIASDPDLLYYEANTAEDLHSAFHIIGQEINYAATNAYFVDMMGNSFSLQMPTVNYNVNGQAKTITPEISFTLYGLYTMADVEAGIITADKIGTRNGRSTVVETVTFSADGTQAYTNGGTENIMRDGVIYANHFRYNTNEYSVMIDTDQDGVDDYLLHNESFYWRMGTINQHDMMLSYYVYLEGSMEGELPAGVYETNESAVLYYTNWLGNDVSRDTVSPQIPWNAASVRYAFYLVDENGLPMVNQELGMTGSFANRLNLTTPTFYALLNASVTLNAAELAAGALPEGYELYDPDASYTVTPGSDDGLSSWSITMGDVASRSTYVTGHDGYQFSNELTENDPAYDYTHTIVWFAVVYTVKAVNDVVVIDYGLPVNIQVLLNDMFYNKGGVVALGPVKSKGNTNGDLRPAPEFMVNDSLATTYEGKYGTAVITTGGIRYTLNKGEGMNMAEPDVFSYAVLYGNKYYYGTVTVIPATTVYYEESFITFENAKGTTGEDTLGVWSSIGSADANATQAADRPGFSNLDILDANNVYGFDGSYSATATYSNGGGTVITVNETLGSAANAPYATFTFTGTGFDVISLTDNTAGTILVTVTDENGRVVASKSVNNYYGYTYHEESGWLPEAQDPNTIWQVPVIKINGLEKGTYTVKIHVIYLTSLAETLYPNGTCTFVLDSIRVYDPAKGNEIADEAHKADHEYAPYYLGFKDLILNSARINGEETLPGVVFIDGKDSTVMAEDYENPGPNNELYLAVGQGISFKLRASAIPASTQLGVKLPYGDNGVIKHGTHDFLHIHSSSNLYYSLNHITWTAVTNDAGEILYYETPVITLSHSDRDYFHSTSSIISFTDFKFTFDEYGHTVEPVVDARTVEEGIAVMSLLYAADAPADDQNRQPPEDGTDTDSPAPDDDTPVDPSTDQVEDNEGDTEAATTPNVGNEENTEPTDNGMEVPEKNTQSQDTNEGNEENTDPQADGADSKGCGAVTSHTSLVALLTLIMLAALALAGRKRERV